MDRGTLIRTILLGIALLNNSLVLAGKSPLPFTNEQLELFVSGAFTTVTALVAWFMNNYVTSKGKAQKTTLERQNLS